ncbi:DNA polymerase IV [Agaribacterium sp. ZY112]|uniref:DNA polymerase IV n=1 Tax=Agaribacterium sp. ZY112 TaxID=3233574 RepID=UPI003523EA0B
MLRKIIHIDADCFYAAVEMRDNPSLKGRPIAVGGNADRRGVLTTANYEARQFGVRSAMSSAQALKLCPDLLILPVRMQAYKDASQQMHEVFAGYTKLIEPLSLDEAYLDVSECKAYQGSATYIAQSIKDKIKAKVGITVSAGVANTKFLAKIASDWQKPNGLFVVPPEQVERFVHELPVAKIHGVGKVSANKLHQLGIYTGADIKEAGLVFLCQRFGRFGKRLFELANGEDGREVSTERIRKSLSVERTFNEDLRGEHAKRYKLADVHQEFLLRLARLDKRYQIKNTFVKLKFSDFSTTTLEQKGSDISPVNYQELMSKALERSPLPIRLLGLGVRLIDLNSQQGQSQLSLFD